MFVAASIQSTVVPILGIALAVVGLCGVIALVSPRSFAVLAGRGNRWIDTASLLAKLETRVEVDARVLPFSRILGATTIIAVVFLSFVLYGR
jgi:hypothetical protein